MIPDSGAETKSGSINTSLVPAMFSILVSIFFVCLFFIIGYHVKLSQENGYKTALATMHEYLSAIEQNTQQIMVLEGKVIKFKNIDRAFRQFAAMPIPDEDMYLAGIGGHAIVDDSQFAGINTNLAQDLHDLFLSINSIDRKVFVEQNSFQSIYTTIEERIDRFNCTPSILPTQSLNITSSFGSRRNPVTGNREFHDAVDFTGPLGHKIFATADGVVTKAEYNSIRGYYIHIQHKYGHTTLYAHLNSILVAEGQEVNKYDVIGTMGRSGRTTGVNLHYALSHNNRKVNPLDYF